MTKEIVKIEESLKKRGLSFEEFRVIKEILYPNVKEDKTLLMAIDYCKARRLDIMKKPIQIVQIWNSERKRMEDTIWSSISEIRITASRTGRYAGKDKALFGENITENLDGVEVTYPEWCEVVVYKMIDGVKCSFSSNEIYWKEAYKTASKNTTKPNEMWAKRTREQLAKCAEAAALRAAFPEEIGNDYIAEEAFASDNMINATPSKTANAHGEPPKVIDQQFQEPKQVDIEEVLGEVEND